MAREIPVLPEVGSRITEPGWSRPSFSAWATMKNAARSLTEPVGFLSSSLAHSRTSPDPAGTAGESRGSPTRGVWPRESSRFSYRMNPIRSVSIWCSARAAGHRGQDGHRVPVLDRGLQAGQEPDVLVVQVHVDEAPQAAVVDQPVAQAAVPLVQVGEQLAERGAGPLDLLGAVGVRAQDRRDANLDGHEQRSTGLS